VDLLARQHIRRTQQVLIQCYASVIVELFVRYDRPMNLGREHDALHISHFLASSVALKPRASHSYGFIPA